MAISLGRKVSSHFAQILQRWKTMKPAKSSPKSWDGREVAVNTYGFLIHHPVLPLQCAKQKITRQLDLSSVKRVAFATSY